MALRRGLPRNSRLASCNAIHDLLAFAKAVAKRARSSRLSVCLESAASANPKSYAARCKAVTCFSASRLPGFTRLMPSLGVGGAIYGNNQHHNAHNQAGAIGFAIG